MHCFAIRRPDLRRLPLAGAMALVCCAAALAHDGHDHEHDRPQPVPEAELYRPTAMPDRILLTWNGDPARTQAVTWRTDTSVRKAVAQIALAEDGPLFVDKAREIPGRTAPHDSDLGPAHYHTADFRDLEPDTLYVYRVGDGVNFSAWIHFRTASDRPEPFTFIYFGDAQNAVKSLWSRVFREAFSDAPRARFMLHAGDLINRGNRDAEWGEWCDAGGWVNAMIPTIAVPGNHEYDIDRRRKLPEDEAAQKRLPRILATRWGHRFEFPNNGPDEFQDHRRETAYYIDVQGVRIVALNSMEDYDVQARWLERVLDDNPNRWTIATHHHPVYSAGEGRDNPELRAAWQPLYDKHKVDLVLQGHDHAYLRTGLRCYENVPEGLTTRSREAGTVYVVSVSGPKMYDLGSTEAVRRAEDTQLYQIISVDGDRLRYEARTAKGDLYDAFTLVKREGQVNEVIEQVPDTPERLRPGTRR